jgi:hypothetical protein
MNDILLPAVDLIIPIYKSISSNGRTKKYLKTPIARGITKPPTKKNAEFA